MKRNLETGKLFGIRKTASQKVEVSKSPRVKVGRADYYATEKAIFEAERKKAEAITILRSYPRIC